MIWYKHVRKSSFVICANILAFVLFLFLPQLMYGGVSVTPKYIFLDGSRKSVSLYIHNPAAIDNEVWITSEFGYVTTDDTGKLVMVMDSIAANEPSAAGWLRFYPQRFILGPGQSQTIRAIASPPAGTAEGEYWSRILVSGKPRKAPVSQKPGAISSSSGVILTTQISLAFHYRVGKVSTGLDVSDLKASIDQRGLNVSMSLKRTGNGAYWGTRTIRLLSNSGKTVYTFTKNTVCFKEFVVHDVLDVAQVPPGRYVLDVEFATAKRSDIKDSDLIQSMVVRQSLPLTVP